MDVLKSKQKQFLDKESVIKEKASIKKNMRDEFIVCTGGSEQQEDIKPKKNKKQKFKGDIQFKEDKKQNQADEQETDSEEQYGEEEEEEIKEAPEEQKNFTIIKDHHKEATNEEFVIRRKDQPEDSRNQKYLKNYRAKVADEHQNKYDDYKQSHFEMKSSAYEGP